MTRSDHGQSESAFVGFAIGFAFVLGGITLLVLHGPVGNKIVGGVLLALGVLYGVAVVRLLLSRDSES